MESLRTSFSLPNKPNTSSENISAYKNEKARYIDKTKGIFLKTASILIVLTLTFSIVRNFIYIDLFNSCFITIDPGVIEFNNSSLVEGLGLIKRISMEDYQKVCQNVKSISPNIGCGGIHGGCYYSTQPKKIYVNTANRNLVHAAAIIVHETCHSIQHENNRSLNENECYIADDAIIKKIVQY